MYSKLPTVSYLDFGYNMLHRCLDACWPWRRYALYWRLSSSVKTAEADFSQFCYCRWFLKYYVKAIIQDILSLTPSATLLVDNVLTSWYCTITDVCCTWR